MGAGETSVQNHAKQAPQTGMTNVFGAGVNAFLTKKIGDVKSWHRQNPLLP
jgi:hypothetical protein